MCAAPDPNAGARAAAKIRHGQRSAKFKSDELKYLNRGTTYKRGKQAAATGLSRARSTAYQNALVAAGRAKQQTENIYKAYYSTQGKSAKFVADKGDEGRSASYGRAAKLSDLLNKTANVEKYVHNTFGRNMDLQMQGIERQYDANLAKNRARLGLKPEFGAPTMMPPKDKRGQFLASLQMGLGMVSSVVGIASGIGALTAPANSVSGAPGGLFTKGRLL